MGPSYINERPDGIYLSVKLQPRASKSEIDGPIGDELKIKVTAPPVDAAANQALVELLSHTLGCSKGAVKIIRGQTSRHKTILISGVNVQTVMEKLA